jgi:serine/threonine protein kinase
MSQEKRSGPPDPAEIAQRYQVIKRLGAGAFGTVYKAKDKILGRMVAIKTIRLEGLAASGGAGLEELMDRFKREAMVSAQLKHPNIVTIYDIGDSEGMSYIAMEFIDGVGLDRVIAGAGRLSVDRAAALAAQVADALDFAHKHNVVHRDIKPANIMVEPGDRVKVTDFGIAKVTDSAEHLTATGSLLGTPSYMSPEQARGSAIDGRSDLFAVGAIVYEMVAGKKAFRGDSITGLIFKIITEEPPPLREQDPDIPEELVRIVARALAKDPAARYQAGRELADDLLALTRPGSTPTLRQSEMATAPGYVPGPTTYIPGSSPTLASTPTQHAAGPPTQVSPGTATRVSSTATRVSPAPPIPPPAPPQGSKTGLLLGLLAGGFALLLAVGVAAFLLLRPRPAPSPGPVAGPLATFAASPSTTLAAVPSPSDVAPSAAASAGPMAKAEPTPPAATTPAAGRETPAPARGGGQRPAPTEPAVAGGAGTSAGTKGAAGAAAAAEPESILDREPPEEDGRAAGDRAAGTYREPRGGNTGSFGTNRRFGARARFPRTSEPAERRAIFVLLNMISFEEAFQKTHGRYGSFKEVLPGGEALPHPNAFQRHGYRFELQADKGEFRVVATPLTMGLRPFLADDSGIVRFADE